MIKLTYYQMENGPREKLLSPDELLEFARKYDWPGVQRIAENLIKGNPLDDRDRLAVERALEIDQSHLELGHFGEFFEVELI
jgi:hypothetical protein